MTQFDNEHLLLTYNNLNQGFLGYNTHLNIKKTQIFEKNLHIRIINQEYLKK